MGIDLSNSLVTGTSNRKNSITSGNSAGRKEPNQEFFQMCLLSFKMNNQDLDEVMNLDQKALYHKCAEQEKKQFFEFQDWISKEVNKIRFKKVYNKNKKNLADQRRERGGMNGIKLVKQFKVYHDYFKEEPE